MDSESVFLDALLLDRAPRTGGTAIRHEKARQLTRSCASYFKSRTRSQLVFVTTFPVMCEIQAYFSRHAVRRQTVLVDLHNRIRLMDWEPMSPIRGIRKTPLDLLRRSQRQASYSLCDALSFVV